MGQDTLYIEERWVTSSLDEDDHWASAVFDVTASGSSHQDGAPQGVDIDEALEWARARADCVVVRLASVTDKEYSAGTRRAYAGEVPLPYWPPSEGKPVRRRPDGWEFLDRTPEDDPIRWAILVAVGQGLEEPPDRLADSFAEQLARRVDAVEHRALYSSSDPPQADIVWGQYGRTGKTTLGEVILASFVMEASTRSEATRLASDAAAAALKAALLDVGIDPGSHDEEYAWDDDEHGWDLTRLVVFPAGSWLAGANCRFDEDGDEWDEAP